MYLNRALCLASFIFITFTSVAQNWAELYKQAQSAYETEEFEIALQKGNEALTIFLSEANPKIENHARILRLLQLITYATSDFETGLAHATKEVSLYASEKQTPYGEALSQQGTFYQAQENYDAAEKSFQESFDILSQFYRAEELPALESRLSIAINVYYQGNEQQALPLLKDPLENYSGEFSPVVIQGLFILGQLSFSQEDFSAAIKSFNRVKSYYETNNLGESADFGALLTVLGQSYGQQDNLNEAETAYALGQKAYEAAGEKNLDYYKLLNARAINFQRLGTPEKSAQLLSTIPDSALTGELAAIILSNRAMSSALNGNSDEATKLYAEALGKLDITHPGQKQLYLETSQNVAMLLNDQGKYSESLKTLTEVEKFFSNDHRTMISLYIKKGIVALRAGEEQLAKSSFIKALTELRKNNATLSNDWIKAMNGLGSVFTALGDFESADSTFQQIITPFDDGRLAKNEHYPVLLNNYASLKQMNGELQRAYDLFFQASRFIKNSSGDKTIAYATTLENLAQLNINRGALTVAKGQIDTTLLIIEKIAGINSFPYASALLTKGKYHQHAGDFPSAEPCFVRANGFLKSNGNAGLADQVRFANAMALFYQTMGNYEEAEPLFKSTIANIEKSAGQASAEYSTALQNLATLYQVESKFDLASPLLEKSLEIDERIFGTSHPQYVITLKNLGVLYQKQGKLDNAQILMERALQVTEKIYGKNHPSYAVTISNLAALYQDQGKYVQAENAWTQSVALRKKILGDEHPDYARSLYGLANLFFANGNLEKAEEYFSIVTSQYLKQVRENFPSMSEKEKGAFYLKIKPVFESYQDFCIQYANKNKGTQKADETLIQLYNIQLTTKAILLNASAKVRQQILATDDPTAIATYNEWLSTKEVVGRYYTLTAEERSGHADIQMLQTKANELEKELSKASEVFRSTFSQNGITSAEVSASLTDEEAAVEIIRIRKKFAKDSIYYVGLILKKNNPTPSLVIWPNGMRLEGRFYKYQRNAIKFMIADTLSYGRFWKPLENQLAGLKHVYISSDGIFNKVNLATLQNSKTMRWVVDDFTLSLVSNTKEILTHSEQDVSETKDVHLYGHIDFNLKMEDHHVATHKNTLTRNFGFDGDIPLLPGTEKEIKQISDLLQPAQWNVSVYSRAEANEESIKKIRNPKILHIATHGFFLNDIDLSDSDDEETGKFLNNPLLRSGLLLAGAGVKEDNTDATTVEDGILTAYEAMNLTLDHTDLVVMSACETGLGEIRNGEGVYGLQRSFLVAGASAVMMSLWQVDDAATQELMVTFYSHWMNGETKLNAFRSAQLKMKEKYHSPYYWGAFIMVGY